MILQILTEMVSNAIMEKVASMSCKAASGNQHISRPEGGQLILVNFLNFGKSI